jgi:hypothetical protein
VPFLRVIRDKRGYETTYLMHWYREGARQRSRILYIFRSPGGVRVGREPLDPEVLRELEAHHPDIDFDWKTVIDNRQVVETSPDLRRPRKRRRGEDELAPAAEAAPSPPPAARPRLDPLPPDLGAAGPAPVAPPRPPIPSTIVGATPDEQIAFLALWYPIVRDRIPQRTSAPSRREALLALAERLNPGAWTDADQIVAGLQQAAESLERLSRVFSRRRRRPKRPSTGSTQLTAGGSTPLTAGRAAHSTSSPLGGLGVTLSAVEGSGSTVSNVEPPVVSEVEPPAPGGVEPPAGSEVEPLGVSEVESPGVSEVEPPGVSEVEPPEVSEVEPPGVSGVEPPGVSGVEPPGVSGVEPPTGADGPAQDEPARASGVTDTSPVDE